ncbi:MAG TPA: class I SAM-dependent methyltransferase [Gammaproteobacteria bacterium]|nr:class I SAM-dependent methyltransferase [Gammaproteobacteria bacterium]
MGYQTDNHLIYQGKEELFATARCLKRYHFDIVHRMISHLEKDPQCILDFGAGIGTLVSEWQQQLGIQPECLEIDPSSQKILSEKNLIVHQSYASLKQNSYDIVYSSNVLEHIEDDQAALRDIYKLIKPGGQLMLFLPAFMCIYNNLDRHVGHFRRYQQHDLKKKVELAGFKVTQAHYCDSLGFFVWGLLKFLGSSSKSHSSNDRSLKFYDAVLYRISTLMDQLGCKYLFGKNIFLTATKL